MATTIATIPLLSLSPIEVRDEFDEVSVVHVHGIIGQLETKLNCIFWQKLERCHSMVKTIMESVSTESEAHDALNTTVSGN